MKEYQVVELLGDGIGPELADASRALFDAMPFKINWEPIDFTVEGRKDQSVYDRAVSAIENAGFAMKYPTATVAEMPGIDPASSPNTQLPRMTSRISTRKTMSMATRRCSITNTPAAVVRRRRCAQHSERRAQRLHPLSAAHRRCAVRLNRPYHADHH